jgi:hypothetical protein
MLTLGDAYTFSARTGGAPNVTIARPPPPPAPTAAQKAVADANAIAAHAKAIADANAYAVSVAKNNAIMQKAAPMTPLTALATAHQLASSIVTTKPARSIWGGGGDGGGGGSPAPSSGEADIPSGASDGGGGGGGPIDYSGTGYTPNRGGGGLPPGASPPPYGGGGASYQDGGGYSGASDPWGQSAPAGTVPAGQIPTSGGGLVQSAGAGDQAVPKNAAAVSGSASIGSADWPWIVGIGVAAVAGVLLWRKFG